MLYFNGFVVSYNLDLYTSICLCAKSTVIFSSNKLTGTIEQIYCCDTTQNFAKEVACGTA